MDTENYFDVHHVVSISTSILTHCECCNEQIGGEDRFAESINHYIEEHAFKLLHAGTQTDRGGGGGLWHSTIALLGK